MNTRCAGNMEVWAFQFTFMALSNWLQRQIQDSSSLGDEWWCGALLGKKFQKKRKAKKKSLKWSHVSHNNKPRLNSSLNVSQENVLFKQIDLKFPAWHQWGNLHDKIPAIPFPKKMSWPKIILSFLLLITSLPHFSTARKKLPFCTTLWSSYSTPVLLPGKSHGRRSLVGCSPWGR